MGVRDQSVGESIRDVHAIAACGVAQRPTGARQDRRAKVERRRENTVVVAQASFKARLAARVIRSDGGLWGELASDAHGAAE